MVVGHRTKVLAMVAVCVTLLGAAPLAAAEEYQPPVSGVVVDPFRPPPQPWASGNRGIDYSTAPGAPVLASAPGEVLFAGEVASDKHVTLVHADGLRTTYSFLATIGVSPGETVPAGGVVGTSAGRFHFGVRAADGTYLDPNQLIAVSVARLVPGGDDGATVIAGPDDGGLWSLLWQVLIDGVVSGDGTLPVLPDLKGLNPALVHYLTEVVAGGNQRQALAAMAGALAPQGPCTPVSDTPPPRSERRILVLVAGYGSTSEVTGVDGVDARGLGYEASDVVRFSYRGGVVPHPNHRLGPLPTRDYVAADSIGDIPLAARRLDELLADIARNQPGVPIDLVGHSQGGVVARRAVAGASVGNTLPAEVATLVTLGSPHAGADLATAGTAVASSPGGRAVLNLAGSLGLAVSADAPALHQLAEVSTPPPDHTDGRFVPKFPDRVRFTSVAARGDPVVPSIRSHTPDALNTTVSVAGPRAHDALPGTAEATREIALAVGGFPPTCRSTPDRLVDVAAGHGVAATHDGLGLALSSLAAAL